MPTLANIYLTDPSLSVIVSSSLHHGYCLPDTILRFASCYYVRIFSLGQCTAGCGRANPPMVGNEILVCALSLGTAPAANGRIGTFDHVKWVGAVTD